MKALEVPTRQQFRSKTNGRYVNEFNGKIKTKI